MTATIASLIAETGNPGWGAIGSVAVKSELSVPPVTKAVTEKGKSPRLRLDTAKSVRAELARVYKMMKAGELKADQATKYGYLLELLSRQIERTDLETRIIALEAKAT